MVQRAFQDDLYGNYCWGCGVANPHGLQIKSYWDGEVAVCTWTPAPQYAAGPRYILNGGIIATLIDCHSVCTAVAAAYRKEGRMIGSDPMIWYVTGTLKVVYQRPARLDRTIHLQARVTDATERKTVVSTRLYADETECATGEVIAVRVPTAWLES